MGHAGAGTVCRTPTCCYTATCTTVSQVCTGMRSKFLFLFYFILLLFYILHGGKSNNYVKDFICFRSVDRPFVSVWSGHSLWNLASSLSYPPLSLFVTVTRCHRHSGCHHYSVTTLSLLVGTTTITTFAWCSAVLQQARRPATSQTTNAF